MDTKDRWVLAKAIALYYYNVDADVWAEEFQTKLIDLGINSTRWLGPYPREQIEKYARGFQSHFGELGFQRQQAMIDLVLDRYGAEAERDWDMAANSGSFLLPPTRQFRERPC